ncbi:MAG TPA: M28 family metallopeptidase [Bacillota bacterium]
MFRHCPWLADNEPRPAGSPACAAAEDAVFAAMQRLGLNPVFQEVPFLGWRADGVRFSVDGRPIPARAMAWSAPVRAAGRLRFAGVRRLIGVFDWPCFELVDAAGRVRAEVYGRDRGPAVPLAKLSPIYPLPGVIIGSDDLQRLLAAAGVVPGAGGQGRDLPAELRIDASFLTDTILRNVIGVWGSGPAEILVAAHHDTMFDSPGANDNGSGVEAMLRVAARVTGSPEAYGAVRWRFCSFGGEELVQVGSEYYAAGREVDGSLADIRLVINLDSVGVGEYFWPWVDATTRPLLEAALPQGLPWRVEILEPPLAGDHYPFQRRGVPAAMLIFWPDVHYHLPGDRAEHLDDARIETAVEVTLGMARGLLAGRR